MKTTTHAMYLVAATFVLGCGGAAIPTQQSAQAKASVRGAEEVGARNEPQAALHLQMARDEIAKAHQYMKKDKNGRARMALERAEIDAELAIALTRAASVQRRAQSAQQEVQELKQRQEQEAGGS